MKKKYKQVLPFNVNMKVSDQFGFSPMSVLEPTKKGKMKWKHAYLENVEFRRSDDCKYLPSLGFSEFHAELAEWIIKYWSLKGDTIVDPFCGRATRAFVSSKLGRDYFGYEISPETYRKVVDHLEKHNSKATIYNEDGVRLEKTPDKSADLVFTCPPYHALERYESVPGQLSDIKSYADFLMSIYDCGSNVMRVLKEGRFFVWVCADWRDAKDFRIFHADSLRIFKEIGFIVWDIIVVKNISPFGALQAGKVAANRYTSKIHEYIIVCRRPGKFVDGEIEIEEEEEPVSAFFEME